MGLLLLKAKRDLGDISFLGPTLDSRITFTRASSRTVFNSAGNMVTLGTNEPGFDYNPLTLQPRGLLLEGARTNLLLNSATLSTQNVTVTAVAHTLSFYGTGTVTLSGVSTAGPLVGTGAFPNRVQLTFTPTAGTLTLTVTGSVTFAQLEVGSFASSYIPTTGTAATRAADSAINSVLASIGYNAAAGTIIAEFETTAQGATEHIFSFDGTAGNFINTRRATGSPATMLSQVSDASVVQADLSLGSVSALTVIKTALAYEANNFAAVINGGSPVTDAAGTVPTVTALRLGSNGLGTNNLFGWLRRLTYYPTRLPNAQLQALTL